MNIHPTAPVCLKNSLVDAMIKRTRIVLFVTVLLIALQLSSCIDRLYGFETDYSTGVPLTPEMIESIIDAATQTEAEKFPVETDENGSLVVYWLPGGSVWHASINCPSIEKASAENIENGLISDAVADGKDRHCKVCSTEIQYSVESDHAQITNESPEDITESEEETLKYPKDYSDDGALIVYWTKSGTVWHESASCSSLANTLKDNLICGSENDAISAGKERACKKCS